MKRSLLVCFFVVLTGLIMVTGCSRSGGGSGQSAGKITIQAILPSNVQDFPSGVTENNNFIVDYWKEKTGYNFDIVVLPLNEDREKLNMMFNAGEIYGIVFEKDMTALSRFQGQDLLQPFDNYMAGSSFFEDFKAYQGKGVLDGKQYGAVILPDGIPCASGLYLVRKDLAVQAGFSRQPETFEEFNKMLTVFKSTGKIPLAIFGSPGGQIGVTGSYGVWDMLQGFFGVPTYRNEWCVRDGKVVSRFVEPAIYDYLVYVKSLYDNEMIPRDFLSLTQNAAIQLYLSGSAASLKVDIWSQPNMMPQSEAKGFDTRYMDYPAGITGQKTWGHFDRLAASQIAFVSKNCKTMPEMVKFLDFLAEPETIMVNNYGVEGKHYTRQGDKIIPTAEGGDNLKWAVYYRNMFLPEDWYSVYGVEAKWAEYYYPSERHSVGYKDFDPVEFMAQSADSVALQNELYETIIDQYFIKAVTGEIPLTRNSFNAMVQQWRDAGGQMLEDTYTRQWTDMGSPDFSGLYASFLPADHPEYTGKYLWDGRE